MLDITVCIMSYNRPQYLREALLSVLNQTQKPKEIVIYDNGSEETVYKAVADLLTNNVKFIGADANQGAIWNFQSAIAATVTKYIMLFHDDDILHENFLVTQVSILENDKLIALSSNGCTIDSSGFKMNALLMSFFKKRPLEIYSTSGDVAIKYANNSCIPLSPTIYETCALKKVKIQKEFDKVLDAVLMCDLAELGLVGCNTTPLYDCRVHEGQDSKQFPFDLMNKLEEFFWTRHCNTNEQKNRLHGLLLKQHATRSLRQIVDACLARNWGHLLQLLKDKKLTFGSLCHVILFKLPKYLIKKMK
jgi:glycosyltransferase involved in cell wall biosynthesis